MKSAMFLMQHPPLSTMQSDATNSSNSSTVKAEIHELLTACLPDDLKKKYADF